MSSTLEKSTLERVALEKFAPEARKSKSVLTKLEPMKCVLTTSASVKVTELATTLVKFAPLRSASVRLVPAAEAPARFAPTRLVPVRLIPSRFAPLRLMPSRLRARRPKSTSSLLRPSMYWLPHVAPGSRRQAVLFAAALQLPLPLFELVEKSGHKVVPHVALAAPRNPWAPRRSVPV